MKVRAGFALPLTILAGCQSLSDRTASASLSVSELRQMIDEQDQVGQVIRVSGFIENDCAGLSCGIVERRSGDGPRVSIEGGTEFESMIHLSRGKWVTLTAKINRPAFYTNPDGTMIVTTDRAPEVTPLGIE